MDPTGAQARFADAMAALVGPMPDVRIGIAVSGGPDSMALLDLADHLYPGRVEAATIDHGLRAEAADEALMVAGWCAAHAIPHVTLRPDRRVEGNVQAWARAVRYALLDQWRAARDIDHVLTAHHADDQLETLLMRLNRGAGLAGLAGVRQRSGPVLRPLLGLRKADLAAYARARELPYVDDPSNSDLRFDRAVLRAHLAGADWLDPIAAGRSAAALAEAEAALAWTVADLAARHITTHDDQVQLTQSDFPREIQRRLLLCMLAIADPAMQPPRGDAIDRLIMTAAAGKQSSIGQWLLVGGDMWTLRRAPARRIG